MSPSTAHPEALADIEALCRRTQSLAMLDAMLCPEWLYRYYSFNSRWSEGAQMASMRDGCGNDWFLLFDEFGAALKGYDKESVLAENGVFPATVQASVPPGFASFLNEPAFSMQRASFCLWRRHTDSGWNVVAMDDAISRSSEDGSLEMLRILDGNPLTYRDWAQDYYEREVALDAVRAVYAFQPLTAELIAKLNPDLSLENVATDAIEIGYP